MPMPLDAPVLEALESGNVANAWLVDLFTDEGTLRAWDKPFNATYMSNTYEGLSDSFGIAGEIRLGSDLVPEPLTFTFDGSLENDSGSFVGRLLDRSWHQRKIRLTGVLFVPGQRFSTAIGKHLEWNGTMDVMEVVDGVGEQTRIALNCEGGIFRALDRNMTTCTHPDQQRRDPTDLFFQNVATKPRQDVPFGRSWSNIPGGSGRGGSGSVGGGSFDFSGGLDTRLGG